MANAIKKELKEHRSSFLVFSILRFLVILVMIRQFFNGNYENVFLGILTLLLLFIPSLVQVSFRIELPTALEIIILLFIFSAEILGEIQYIDSFLGHDFAYAQRFFGGGHRFFSGGAAQ